MAHFERIPLSGQVYFFPEIESTNIYAIQTIEHGEAVAGDTFWALTQTKGRGQRGKAWNDVPGNSLLMSLIVAPALRLEQQFLFSMAVSIGIAKYLQSLKADMDVCIKWPNDIYINDKKAAGILIENTVRGGQWAYAVIGMGLNVRQEHFPESLPHAVSLKMATGNDYGLEPLLLDLRAAILAAVQPLGSANADDYLKDYNALLFMKNKWVHFRNKEDQRVFKAEVLGVDRDGRLSLWTENGISAFTFGSLEWLL